MTNLNIICLFVIQSSGSGSESGIRTQKCTKPKVDDEYENNSGSNNDNEDDDDNDEDDDDLSVGHNARDGSDNGSGTQVRDRLLLFETVLLLCVVSIARYI